MCGSNPNSPGTGLGAGQCLKVPGKNDQVLWCRSPEGPPLFSLSCIPAQFYAHPKAKLREYSRVSPNHRKVSQGLPGGCVPDQLRNEPTWEKQGQTPQPILPFKLPVAAICLMENFYGIRRGLQDSTLILCWIWFYVRKSVTPVLPQPRSWGHQQSHGFWKEEPDSHCLSSLIVRTANVIWQFLRSSKKRNNTVILFFNTGRPCINHSVYLIKGLLWRCFCVCSSSRILREYKLIKKNTHIYRVPISTQQTWRVLCKNKTNSLQKGSYMGEPHMWNPLKFLGSVRISPE